jgi:hypothetical protein
VRLFVFLQLLAAETFENGMPIQHVGQWCLHAGGDLAAVYKERQQVQLEVWEAATAESVRATLASQFPDLTHRTVITLNNAAEEEGEPVAPGEGK